MWLKDHPPIDESDGSPLPRLTGCYDTETPGVSLTGRRVFQMIVAASVMALLGVGQVYLRLAIQEIKVEHGRVQQEHNDLLRRITALEHQYARLTDPDRLRTLAVEELQMEEVEPQSQVLAVVPPTLTKRYMGELSSASGDRIGDDEALGEHVENRGEQLVRTLLDVNRAFAQPLYRREP
jgi:hypothetical protein